jgi:hypothetical protein
VASQQPDQGVGVQRLADEVVHAAFQRALTLRHQGAGGQGDDGQIPQTQILAQASRGLVPSMTGIWTSISTAWKLPGAAAAGPGPPGRGCRR